jgi:hypothetical protein
MPCAPARADRIADPPGAGQQAAAGVDVHEPGIHARGAHRIQCLGQPKQLDIGIGLILAGHGQVAEGAAERQVAAPRDPERQLDGGPRSDPLPPKPGVDLELHRYAPSGVSRGALEGPRPPVIDDQLQVSRQRRNPRGAEPQAGGSASIGLAQVRPLAQVATASRSTRGAGCETSIAPCPWALAFTAMTPRSCQPPHDGQVAGQGRGRSRSGPMRAPGLTACHAGGRRGAARWRSAGVGDVRATTPARPIRSSAIAPLRRAPPPTSWRVNGRPAAGTRRSRRRAHPAPRGGRPGGDIGPGRSPFGGDDRGAPFHDDLSQRAAACAASARCVIRNFSPSGRGRAKLAGVRGEHQ